MSNNLVVHFEIYASNISQLITFYEKVLDWKFKAIPQYNYWLVYPGEVSNGPPEKGINGGMMLRSGPKSENDSASPNAFVCTVSVEKVDQIVKLAEANGAKIDMAPSDVPGVGRLAYIRDPDGNMLGLLQEL